MTTLRTSLLLALALGAGGCLRSDPAPIEAPTASADPLTSAPSPTTTEGEDAELRVYETPPGRAAEVAGVLQRVLRGTDETPPRGTVTAAHGDRVVVVAPPSLHRGIEPLCRDLTKTSDAPRTATVQYWLVRAEPSEATDTSAVPMLADTLNEVATLDGAATFSLVERMRVSSLVDATGRAEGTHARIRQVVSARERTILADLDVDVTPPRAPGAELHTRVRLSPEDTVVIGQSGWTDHMPTPEGGTDDSERLYYVVRAELDDAR